MPGKDWRIDNQVTSCAVGGELDIRTGRDRSADSYRAIDGLQLGIVPGRDSGEGGITGCRVGGIDNDAFHRNRADRADLNRVAFVDISIPARTGSDSIDSHVKGCSSGTDTSSRG